MTDEQGGWPTMRVIESPLIPIEWADGETERDLGGVIVVRRSVPPQPTDEQRKCPECAHPLEVHQDGFGCTAGCVCQYGEPHVSTDEQQAERRIADAWDEWLATHDRHRAGSVYWPGFEAGYRAAEAPLQTQIARLEAERDGLAAEGDVLMRKANEARAEVMALEERLAAVTAGPAAE